MVMSLSDSCLLHIRNCIIDGTLPTDLEAVSPALRQRIFRMLAMQQKLSNKNCLQFMKDSQFFNVGFSTVDILPTENRRCSQTHPRKYYGFLQFFSSIISNVPDLADNITTLRLAYVLDMTASMSIQSVDLAEDFRKSLSGQIVIDLIGKCKNLKRLRLVMLETTQVQSTPYLLTELAEAVRNSGSPGLEEFEVCNMQIHGEFECRTPSQKWIFHRLKHLRLQTVFLQDSAWRNILGCCHRTLESLILESFHHRDPLITIELDQLRSLTIRDTYSQQDAIDVVKYCPKLESYHFDLHGGKITESQSGLESVIRSIGNCTVAITPPIKNPAYLCRFIDIASTKIVELELLIHAEFTEEIFRRIVLGLPNLQTLKLNCRLDERSTALYDQFLTYFLRDKTRAEKMQKMYLPGDLSDQTAELLFSNCVRLSTLKLGSIFKLRDQHVLLWTERGARPSSVHYYGDLTDVGLKALMEASGSNLEQLEDTEYEPGNTDAVLETLVNCCPMLERINLNAVSARLCDDYARLGRKFIYRVLTR